MDTGNKLELDAEVRQVVQAAARLVNDHALVVHQAVREAEHPVPHLRPAAPADLKRMRVEERRHGKVLVAALGSARARSRRRDACGRVVGGEVLCDIPPLVEAARAATRRPEEREGLHGDRGRATRRSRDWVNRRQAHRLVIAVAAAHCHVLLRIEGQPYGGRGREARSGRHASDLVAHRVVRRGRE